MCIFDSVVFQLVYPDLIIREKSISKGKNAIVSCLRRDFENPNRVTEFRPIHL